jgi:hypothetical protein
VEGRFGGGKIDAVTADDTAEPCPPLSASACLPALTLDQGEGDVFRKPSGAIGKGPIVFRPRSRVPRLDTSNREPSTMISFGPLLSPLPCTRSSLVSTLGG